jgi:outer membrane protein
MNHLRSNIAISISSIALVLIIYVVVKEHSEKKIAYIRSSELVYGYLGMQDAHNKYEEKNSTWKSNADTLQHDFERSLAAYRAKEQKLSKVEKDREEKMLQAKKEQIIQYMQAVSNQSKEEDEKVTQAVLNQVNSFVEEYGKKNNYKIILGTTLSGNLLYGEEGIDITKEVLEELNKNYKGEQLTSK